MVKVLPKNDEMRKVLRHPSDNVNFRPEGPMDWPDDSFTARRIADGDVTVVEETEEKKSEAVEAAPVEEKPAEETPVVEETPADHHKRKR